MKNFEISFKSFCCLLFLCICFASIGQNDNPVKFAKAKWNIEDVFDYKVFIENRGQYNTEDLTSAATKVKQDQIMYVVDQEGMQMYFTKKGLVYRHDIIPQASEMESEERELSSVEEKKKGITSEFVYMDWLGASSDVQMITESPVSYYFTYSSLADGTGKTGIKAPAFQKLIYKNIYPNIDVEYTFPKDKKGIKYAFILHPGADVTSIKMNYSGGNLSLDEEKNVKIHTPFGDITDHKPLTFYKQDEKASIGSSFRINENLVTFELQEYDHSQTVVIDPWTTNPAFNIFNSAYDVEYDFFGNVYVYGGKLPWQEIKLDSNGNILWVYTAAPISLYNYYGDFAVDPSSGSSYLAEGLRVAGARVLKVDPMGNPLGVSPGIPTYREMWRIVYDNCNKQLITVGGGKIAGSFQACIVDTNVSVLSPVNVLGTTEMKHDFSLLSLDNSGNCFMATAQSEWYTSFNNVVLKCPSNGLLPVSYMLPDNHRFYECYSVSYVVGSTPLANGFNGMAVSGNNLYTYDGNLLQRWNKNTGALLNSTIAIAAPIGTHGQVINYWGGLAADDCNNIYAGVGFNIIQYDTAFNIVSVLPAPNYMYDIELGPNNLLYASGYGFVSSFQLNGSACNTFNIAVTPNDSCGKETATATITGGNGPYSYSWNTSPVQTTATTSALPAGTYTVTVIDGSCVPKLDTASVTIIAPVIFATSITGPSTICDGQSVSLVAGSGIIYNWSTTASTPTITISPGTTTTYNVEVTDSFGCKDTAWQTILVNPKPVADLSGITSICLGEYTTLIAGGGGTYAWNTGETNQSITVNPEVATSYSVVVSNGLCLDTTSINVIVHYLDINAGSSANTSSSIQLYASGSGPFQWSPTTGLSCSDCQEPFAYPSETTTYCVTTTDIYGCSDTACVEIIVSTVYIPNCFTPNNNYLNDLFKPIIKDVHDYSFLIFNRWGEKIFETSDIKDGWNGCYKGEICEQDAYVYKINFVDDEKNKYHQYIGNVTLLR